MSNVHVKTWITEKQSENEASTSGSGWKATSAVDL